ncbi:MAG: hypothetical protein J5809_04320 [Selenomonadaceae bacterium]|nr:hypothetical protein [Selenomonadaceae bacterium]
MKNDDSRDKLELGLDWQVRAGENFRYYMVFDNEAIAAPNSCTINEFLKTVSAL